MYEVQSIGFYSQEIFSMTVKNATMACILLDVLNTRDAQIVTAMEMPDGSFKVTYQVERKK